MQFLSSKYAYTARLLGFHLQACFQPFSSRVAFFLVRCLYSVCLLFRVLRLPLFLALFFTVFLLLVLTPWTTGLWKVGAVMVLLLVIAFGASMFLLFSAVALARVPLLGEVFVYASGSLRLHFGTATFDLRGPGEPTGDTGLDISFSSSCWAHLLVYLAVPLLAAFAPLWSFQWLLRCGISVGLWVNGWSTLASLASLGCSLFVSAVFASFHYFLLCALSDLLLCITVPRFIVLGRSCFFFVSRCWGLQSGVLAHSAPSLCAVAVYRCPSSLRPLCSGIAAPSFRLPVFV